MARLLSFVYLILSSGLLHFNGIAKVGFPPSCLLWKLNELLMICVRITNGTFTFRAHQYPDGSRWFPWKLQLKRKDGVSLNIQKRFWIGFMKPRRGEKAFLGLVCFCHTAFLFNLLMQERNLLCFNWMISKWTAI